MTSEYNVKIVKLDSVNRIRVTGMIEDGKWVAIVREGEDIAIKELDGDVITVRKVKGNSIFLSKAEAEEIVRELDLNSNRYIALVDVDGRILIKKPFIGGGNAVREGDREKEEVRAEGSEGA